MLQPQIDYIKTLFVFIKFFHNFQLPLHPGHDDIIVHVVQIAFQHFRYNDPNQLGLLTTNAMIIADLFAEVIGTLAQSRFSLVRKKFMCDLMELRAKEQTPLVVQNVVSLLMGMKFFRVKVNEK